MTVVVQSPHPAPDVRCPRIESVGATGRLQRRAGFTIIELLVVVAIIIIIVSLILVAMNAAGRASQRTRTAALLDSMKKALISFKNDVGYYPPMLGPAATPVERLRELLPPPNPDAGSYIIDAQNYYSSAVMADYLIGYDVGANDGYGYPAPANETPPTGIRHPGSDGVWEATTSPAPAAAVPGSVDARNPPTSGKRLGPYLELTDERLLASTDGMYQPGSTEVLNTYFPGSSGYNATHPKIIVDYWGSPIRYYRRPYPPGALGQSYRAVDRNGDGTVDRVPTLSDVFLLRPWEIEPGSESTGLADAAGNTATTRELDAAEFALFSSGADRAMNDEIAVDPEEFNKDNIVVVGP